MKNRAGESLGVAAFSILLVSQFVLSGCAATTLSSSPPSPPDQLINEMALVETEIAADIREFSGVARHFPLVQRFEYVRGDAEGDMTFRFWGRDRGTQKNNDDGLMGEVVFRCEGSGVRFRLYAKLNGGGDIRAEGVELDGKVYSLNGSISGIPGQQGINLVSGNRDQEEPEGYLVSQMIKRLLAVFKQMVREYYEMRQSGPAVFPGFGGFVPDDFQRHYHRRYFEKRVPYHKRFAPPPHRKAPDYYGQGVPRPKV